MFHANNQFQRILLSERVPFTCISSWSCKFIIFKICRRLIRFILDVNLLLIPLKISVIFFLGPEQHHCYSSLPDWQRSENMEFQLKGSFLEMIQILLLFDYIMLSLARTVFIKYLISKFHDCWFFLLWYGIWFPLYASFTDLSIAR